MSPRYLHSNLCLFTLSWVPNLILISLVDHLFSCSFQSSKGLLMFIDQQKLSIYVKQQLWGQSEYFSNWSEDKCYADAVKIFVKRYTQQKLSFTNNTWWKKTFMQQRCHYWTNLPHSNFFTSFWLWNNLFSDLALDDVRQVLVGLCCQACIPRILSMDKVFVLPSLAMD